MDWVMHLIAVPPSEDAARNTSTWQDSDAGGILNEGELLSSLYIVLLMEDAKLSTLGPKCQPLILWNIQ